MLARMLAAGLQRFGTLTPAQLKALRALREESADPQVRKALDTLMFTKPPIPGLSTSPALTRARQNSERLTHDIFPAGKPSDVVRHDGGALAGKQEFNIANGCSHDRGWIE